MSVVKVYAVKSAALTGGEREYLALLPSVFREEVLRHKTEEGRTLALLSALLKRRFIGLENVGKSANGKPCAENAYFNISHSKDVAVIAIAENEVGIDVEKIRSANRETIGRIADAEDLSHVADDKTFFEIWTAKESLVKANGDGIKGLSAAKALPLNGKKIYSGKTYYTKSFSDGEYVFCVALRDSDFETDYREINLREIL